MTRRTAAEMMLNVTMSFEVAFDVACSKGTYIRTLCNDIGEDLGTFGYMSNLLRVSVGPFKIKNSYRKEDLEKMSISQLEKILLPIDFALMDFESIVIKDDLYKRLVNGVKIEIENNKIDLETILRVYSNNEFIGLGNIIEKNGISLLKMKKVFV